MSHVVTLAQTGHGITLSDVGKASKQKLRSTQVCRRREETYSCFEALTLETFGPRLKPDFTLGPLPLGTACLCEHLSREHCAVVRKSSITSIVA